MSRMISGGMLVKLTWVGVPQVSQMIVLPCGDISVGVFSVNVVEPEEIIAAGTAKLRLLVQVCRRSFRFSVASTMIGNTGLRVTVVAPRCAFRVAVSGRVPLVLSR